MHNKKETVFFENTGITIRDALKNRMMARDSNRRGRPRDIKLGVKNGGIEE